MSTLISSLNLESNLPDTARCDSEVHALPAQPATNSFAQGGRQQGQFRFLSGQFRTRIPFHNQDQNNPKVFSIEKLSSS